MLDDTLPPAAATVAADAAALGHSSEEEKDQEEVGLETAMAKLSTSSHNKPQSTPSTTTARASQNNSNTYSEHRHHNAAAAVSRPYEQILPIRPNTNVCEFYLKAGWCRFGEHCRFSHPPEIANQHRPKAYNTMGFPLREDAGDCQYFLHSRGRCKFGSTCKYNHPQHVIDAALQHHQANFMYISPNSSPILFATPPPPPQLATTASSEYFGMLYPTNAAFCGHLYYTGTCPFGDQCLYSHQASPVLLSSPYQATV